MFDTKSQPESYEVVQQKNYFLADHDEQGYWIWEQIFLPDQMII